MEHDPRYLKGIEHFNACDFFEAHEVWEELWTETEGADRRFYQGLIQVAVCLHHFGNGNLRGAQKLYHSCRGYLDDYAPWHMGVDVSKLLAELEDCCVEILQPEAVESKIEIDPQRIPEIHLSPPA